jgi:hypothetical protein
MNEQVPQMPPTPPATETPIPIPPTPSVNNVMPPTPPATGEDNLQTSEASEANSFSDSDDSHTVELSEETTEWHGEVEETNEDNLVEPTQTPLPPTPTPTFEQDYVLMDAIESYLQDYLHQSYFVDSILKISTKMLENERAVKEAFEQADSFIDAEAWLDCARDAIKTFQPFSRSAFGDENK